jgi:hypothetical protein
LVCKDESSPVVIEAADGKDFAAFCKAVAALPLTYEKRVLTYQGLSGDRFTLHADYSRPPEINGKPVNYAPPMAFDSPFVRGEWDGGVVTIAKGRRRLVLDFNKP